MKPRSVFLIAGARPNFVKVAPLYSELAASPKFSVTLVHTGQHYDQEMSDVFFEELGIPARNRKLESSRLISDQ